MLEFILLKRRLGALYDFEERTLANLDRYLFQAGISLEGEVTPVIIHEWLESHTNANARTRNTKRQIAEQFFDHAMSLGVFERNPAHFRFGGKRQLRRPFIFSNDQVQRILDRASTLPDIPFFPHRGTTYALIFGTLFCLGLRAGEICRVCLDDVNLGQGLLLIRRSKFYKSRLLPLGPRLLNRLGVDL